MCLKYSLAPIAETNDILVSPTYTLESPHP